jgi:aminomethyltransferase
VALDIARVEAGLLLIEVDYISSQKALIEARKSSPYEAGLGWTVALDKGPFIGRSALSAEKKSGSKWSLVGLDVDWPALEKLFAVHDLPPMVPARTDRTAVPLYNENGRQVGQVTSRTFSPILKKYIALATVESRYDKPGTRLQAEVTVEYTRQKALATVTKTPFYNPPRKRA